jgi:hypothetical protein
MTTTFDYTHIPGWFNFESVYERMVREAPNPAVFVEVGAWLGKSTAFLASTIRASGKRIRLMVVDTWYGSDLEQTQKKLIQQLGGDAFPTFRANMERAGVWQTVEPLQRPSVDAASTLANESVDFVFLDAGHDYWSVAADILAWWPKIKPGGWLGGHDYGDWVGVTRAVDDLLGPIETIPEASSWMTRKEINRPPRSMALPPKVGVITPHFSAEPQHFRHCVLSVRRQTIPCIHYVVCDGDEPVWPDNPRDTCVARIPGPHRDGGNAACAVGGMLAAADGCDAVAFLDADAWYEPDHIQSLFEIHRQTGAVICTSGRKLFTREGQLLGSSPDIDGERCVDRSGLFLLRVVFGLISHLATVHAGQRPPRVQSIWDQFKESAAIRVHTGRDTLACRTRAMAQDTTFERSAQAHDNDEIQSSVQQGSMKPENS